MVVRDKDMQARLMYIGEPGANQDQIVVACESQSDIQLVKTLNSLDKLVKEIRAAEPDIIMIGPRVAGQGSLDVIDDIVMQYPEVPLVAILGGKRSHARPAGDAGRGQGFYHRTIHTG